MKAMIKRMLLATDGSPPARSAEALALFLARRLSAELVALFVKDVRLIRFPELLDFGAISVPVPTYHEAIDEALEARGKAVIERLSREAEGLRFEGVIRTGVPYEVIAKEARAFDLVAIGRAGEQAGHEATGLGSTVERVARTSPVPVLVAALDFAEPERLVVGYDGSDSAARALHFAADLLEGIALEALVASVDEDLDRAALLAAEGVEYLRAHGAKAHAKPLSGDPAQELVQLAEPSDLLVMGAFGRGRVFELLLGSTTEYVLRRAACPVALVR